MATYDGIIDPVAAWVDVQQLSTSALLKGGVGGPLNQQATELTARTKFMKDRLTPTVEEFVATGAQTAFVVASLPLSKNASMIHVNGVYKLKSSYTLSGSTFTLDTGATVGQVVEISYTVA